MADEKDSLTLDKRTIDVLVANIIPTSKYFESRFDHLQYQINEIKTDIKEFERRVDDRFEQVDKRFEQIDKRFEQIDKRFEQIELKLDKLLERIDVKIDAGLRENRVFSLRLFTFAMTFAAVSIIGLFGKIFRLF
jgi:predicted transcriptional regulator